MSMFRRRLMIAAALEQQPQPPQGKYIKFEDKEVERICMANFSSDGIGVSYEDALIPRKISNTLFKENKIITSFKELKYFENVGSIQDYTFSGCTNLISITLPKKTKILYHAAFSGCKHLRLINLDNITQMSYWCFSGTHDLCIDLYMPQLFFMQDNGNHVFDKSGIKRVISLGNVAYINNMFTNCLNLTFVRLPSTIKGITSAFGNDTLLDTIICEAINPPTLDTTALNNTPSLANIYVPDESVTAYKTAENWSAYADKIKPLSEYQP